MVLGYLAGGLLVLILVPSVIYVLTFLLDHLFRVEIFRNPAVKWITAALLLLSGFTLGIWSIVLQNTIGKGGPVEIGNIEISPKTEHLVTTGPYQYTRNPMLFGTFLIYLAFAGVINSLTAVGLVVLLFIFMLTVVVSMEERRLSKDFGDQYEEYRKRVSRFIPWFHTPINR